jgi:hypothetical protein
MKYLLFFLLFLAACNHLIEPQIKHRIVIGETYYQSRTISFWTDEETAKNFNKFGEITNDNGSNLYLLTVDGRYDFEEVAYWIENYEKREK